MTKLLIKIFVKDHEQITNPQVRGKYGVMAGIVGIICNVILFFAKLIIGTVSASLSITADAVNNLADASSSIMTLLGFQIAKKPADEEHPFGHARFEYLSGLAIAALILIVGYQLIKSSVEKILHPTDVEFSAALVIVLIISICVKLWLAAFNKSIGKRISSTSLIATATDSRNDVISTASVLLAAILTQIIDFNLDGYMGFLVALFILYSGVGIAKETIKPLLGAPADEELVKMIVQETLSYDKRILGIHDLMVHDYGPGQCFASLHAEIDYRENVLDAHEVLDNIEMMFKKKHNVQMVIHYDPIITDDAELNEMKSLIQEKLKEIDDRLTLHDFRMVRGSEHTNLIFDIVIPFDLKGQEKEIRKIINESIQNPNMKYYLIITFDSQSFNMFQQAL